MNKEELKLHTKATALNEIRKIYHPLYNGLSSNNWDESWAEQRDYMVKRIIKKLEKDLKKLKS